MWQKVSEDRVIPSTRVSGRTRASTDLSVSCGSRVLSFFLSLSGRNRQPPPSPRRRRLPPLLSLPPLITNVCSRVPLESWEPECESNGGT